MHRDRSGYWADGQVSEFCGELIDTDHTDDPRARPAVRPPGRRPPRRRAAGLDRRPTGSSAAAIRPRRPTPTSSRCATRLKRDLTAAGYPTALEQVQARRRGARPDEHLRLDRVARARAATARPSGGCSTSPTTIEYGAETTEQSSLNLVYLLGLPARAQGLRRSSACPTSASTSAAATSGCPRRSRPRCPTCRARLAH